MRTTNHTVKTLLLKTVWWLWISANSCHHTSVIRIPKTQWCWNPNSNPNLTFPTDYSNTVMFPPFNQFAMLPINQFKKQQFCTPIATFTTFTHSHNILNAIYFIWHCKSHSFGNCGATLFSSLPTVTCLYCSFYALSITYSDTFIEYVSCYQNTKITW